MVSRRVYFSVINNAVYIAFGPILTILGAYMFYFYHQFEPLVDELTWMMPMGFMILGLCTIVLAIYACLQLATEFMCSAICYFIAVVLLILALIGSGAFWVNVSPSYPSFVNNTFDKAYSSFEDYQLHQTWETLQTELQCCGLNGMSDFESVHTDIPIDCCRNKTVLLCSPDDIILEGCLHAFLYRVYLDRYVIGTTAILGGTLMLMMLISSVFVCFDDDDDITGGHNPDDPYCIDDEQDGQYFTQVRSPGMPLTGYGRSGEGTGAIVVEQQEKHPAFAGIDLTYVPDQTPQVAQNAQQQTIIVQQTPSTSADGGTTETITIPSPAQQPPPPSHVVVEEINPRTSIPVMPSPAPPTQHRLVRVVKKLPMFEPAPGSSRMRYYSPTSINAGGTCRRCSHVSKCKRRRQGGMSLLDNVVPVMRSTSRTSVRRMSNSPDHEMLEAPKANMNFHCRKIDGRTICRATPVD